MTHNEPTRLAELICVKAASHPELDVLTFVSIDSAGNYHEEIRTYRDLWNNGRRLACGLLEQGLNPGERFAIIMRNHPQFVEAMIAASITGTVFVPVDPGVSGSKLAYLLEFAECKGAIVADYALSNLKEIQASLKHFSWTFVLNSKLSGVPSLSGNGIVDLAGLLARSVPDVAMSSCDPSETMQLLFTSGTTANPKAIEAPHSRFMSAGAAAPLFGFQPDDRPYTGLPLTHANAQMVSLGAMLCMGLRGVISRKFTRSRLWDITRRYGCTVFNLLGGMTVGLYSEQETDADADNPVRLVVSAGMPAPIWEKFHTRFGVDILEFYGAAEGGLTINPPGVGPVGSVGKPPEGLEVVVLDEMGEHCPPGVAGEICFRLQTGQAPTVRYFADLSSTARKTTGGWLHMGDVGLLDNEGWLFFLHRMGDDIRRNGEFIDRGVVEKTVAECASVSDVFVYGVPAASGVPGEKDLVAAIVPVDIARFSPQQVFAHCQERLESNYVPSYLQVVSELPKTASEKPQERVLHTTFAADAPNVFALNRLLPIAREATN